MKRQPPPTPEDDRPQQPSKFQQLKSQLSSRGLSPQKAFGQNFMLDPNFAAAIARDAAPDERTLVLEVGPGTGALTEAILQAHRSARVLAIEIDRGLAKLLRENFAAEIAAARLTLIEGDVLARKHAINPQFAAEANRISAVENRPRRVLCANLPYNAATPLLANLAVENSALQVETAIVTIQLELAERMLAMPESDSYGALSALIGLRAKGQILRRVGAEVFWPRPKVDSAVLRLDFLPWNEDPQQLQRSEAEPFQQFLQTTFSQRRKTLRAVLRDAESIRAAGLAETARAEELPPDKLLQLFRLHRKTKS